MPSNFFLSNSKVGNKKDSGQKRKYEENQKGRTKMKKKFTVHSKSKGTESKSLKSKLNIMRFYHVFII